MDLVCSPTSSDVPVYNNNSIDGFGSFVHTHSTQKPEQQPALTEKEGVYSGTRGFEILIKFFSVFNYRYFFI